MCRYKLDRNTTKKSRLQSDVRRRVQAVRVAHEVHVMVMVQSVLLRVRQCRAVPGQMAAVALLEDGFAWVRMALRRRAQLTQEVHGLGRGESRLVARAEDGLRNHLGLQEGQDPRVLVVFGLRALHRGQVVHQVLHALVVAVVEVVRELAQELSCRQDYNT